MQETPTPRALEPWGLLVAALACGLALPIAFVATSFMDEVTLLDHSRRVLAGEVIYRDFFEFLAPLTSWLGAWLFLLLPPSIQAARVLTAVFLGVAAWQLYRIARLLGLPGPVAGLPGLLLVGALYVNVPGYSHHWIVQPFLWGAVLGAVRGAAPDAGLKPWGLAGVGIGLAGLTIQSDGVLLVLALLLWSVLDAWLGGTPRGRVLARLGAAGLGCALPLGLAVAYLAWHHALGAAVQDVWFWTLAHYKVRGGINDVKYLTDLSFQLATTNADFKLWKWYAHTFWLLYAYMLPLGIGALVLARAGGLLLGRTGWTLTTARLALVAIVMLGIFATLLKGRADAIHAVCYLPPTLLVATTLAWRWRTAWPGPELALVRWLPLASLLAFGAAGLLLAGAATRLDPEWRLEAQGPDGHMRRDAAVMYLRAHGRPGDRLAVFPLGARYYFYGLPAATRYTSMLDPAEGYYDRADYEHFWQEVAAARPRFLLFAPLGPTGETPTPPASLTGYRQVAALSLDYLGKPARAVVYERTP